MSGRPCVRITLAVLSASIFGAIIIFAAWSWQPIGIVRDHVLTDLLKAAIDIKVEQSRSEFQLSLVAMGALWGLMIAKKDEAGIVLSDVPELIMFCCSSLLLIGSSIFHFLYVDNIAYIYWLAGTIEGGKSIPDVAQSGINNPFYFQFWSLLSGMVIAALTLFSAHRLK